jgi:hypothetical protein
MAAKLRPLMAKSRAMIDTGSRDLLDRGNYKEDKLGIEVIYLGMPDREHFNLAYSAYGGFTPAITYPSHAKEIRIDGVKYYVIAVSPLFLTVDLLQNE